jgi:hydroxyacylglutathione hydrolase
LDRTFRIERAVTRDFDQNCYLLWREGETQAIIFDPGFDLRVPRSTLQHNHLQIAAIVNTHGHLDHIAGNAPLRHDHPEVPIWIGRNDAHMLTSPAGNLSLFYGSPVTSPPADRLIEAGEVFDLAGFRFEAREIPGHSPGSLVLVAQDESSPFAIVGDVIFRGSIGRTDFPGGSLETLLAGIQSKVLDLPDDVALYPGHGPSTTVGRERVSNPYLQPGLGT